MKSLGNSHDTFSTNRLIGRYFSKIFDKLSLLFNAHKTNNSALRA